MKPNRPNGFGARGPRGAAARARRRAGAAARLAAAHAVADVADLRAPAGGARRRRRSREPASPGSTRATARWRDRSPTVSFRRLGTIRKALGRFLEKGLPKRAGALEWILIAAAAQILFLDLPDHAAVDLAVRATRLDPGAAPFAALVNAVLRNLARAREEILAARRPARRRHAALARPALARDLRRGDGAAESRAPIATSRRSTSASRATPKVGRGGSAASSCPPDRFAWRPTSPIGELDGYADGEWWVQDAAAALPARLLGVARGRARRRSLRRPRRQERRIGARGREASPPSTARPSG